MRNSLNLASLGLLRQGAARALSTATDGLIRLGENQQQPVIPGGGGASFGTASIEATNPEIRPEGRTLIQRNNDALLLMLLG